MGKTLIDGRYEVRGPVGSGGMADVFLAHDNILDRDVALKLLKEQYAENEEFVERFRREARSAAALSHPHIVPVFARGRSEDGTYYIAMEYVPGGTLKDRIMSEQALSPYTVVKVALQIAEALQTAHEHGVIHRDIKPHNILITASGDVKVADFGIARAAEASTISNFGDILGSAKYMSPEQAAGEPVGPASDLYSLGVILYEMLTGTVPIEAGTPADVSARRADELSPHPREVNPEIPEGVDTLVMRLLSRDPAERYGSAAEHIEELRRIRDGLSPVASLGDDATTAALAPPAARTFPAPALDGTGPRWKKWFPIVAVFTFLALLIFVGWSLWRDHNDGRILVTATLLVAIALLLWAFAVFLWDLLEGRMRGWLRGVLVVVLAPACALAAAAVSVLAGLAFGLAFEPDEAPVGPSEMRPRIEPTQPMMTPEEGTSSEATTDRTASPSTTPTSSPSASPSAAPSATAFPSAAPSALPSPSASPWPGE
jgi:hypothetical protein